MTIATGTVHLRTWVYAPNAGNTMVIVITVYVTIAEVLPLFALTAIC